MLHPTKSGAELRRRLEGDDVAKWVIFCIGIRVCAAAIRRRLPSVLKLVLPSGKLFAVVPAILRKPIPVDGIVSRRGTGRGAREVLDPVVELHHVGQDNNFSLLVSKS